MPRAAVSLLSVVVMLASAAAHAAGPRSILGQTFSIAEPDLMEEIKRRAASTDWKAMMQRKDPSTFSAFQTANLPPTASPASFLFDPTYTLPQHVVDGRGTVLYPAGTTINVYERRKFPGRTIVISPTIEHFKWLNEVAKPTAQDKVLMAGANMLDVQQLAGANRVYALDARIIERFGLRSVPSIVQQEGTLLRVQEFVIAEAGRKTVARKDLAPISSPAAPAPSSNGAKP